MQPKYKMEELVPTTNFSQHYEKTKKGYLKMIKEAKKTFSNFNVSINDAEKFYILNTKVANEQIEEVNMYFAKRSFWSSIGSFFKGVGHSIATAATSIAVVATFGQVKAIKDAVKSEAKKTREEFIKGGKEFIKPDTGEDVLNLVASGLGLVSGIKNINGEELANAANDFGKTIHN